MLNRIIVVGSYNVDMTITTDEFPQAGETVTGSSLSYGHGGKGANQAIAAARSGAPTTLFAKVGDDQYGDKAIQALKSDGINTHLIQKAHGTPTGMASITVNAKGENSIVVLPGANWHLSASELKAEKKYFQEVDILLTQLETSLESVSAAIKCAKDAGTTVILNPAPAQPLPRQLLRKVDIITPNRIEVEMLTGVKITNDQSLSQAAENLHKQGITVVLITLGTRGVFLSLPNESKLIPAIKVEAVDTVGAGDVFNGVLAAHYSGIETIEEVVELAVIAAGLSVTKTGAQNAIPNQKTIQAYRQKHTAVVG